MDTLAALALATEPPTDELLKRKPYSRFEGLITEDMWRNVISQGILQVIILGTILFKGNSILIQDLKFSVFLPQLVIIMNIGKRKMQSIILCSLTLL